VPAAFENRQARILSWYWMTDFSALNWELLETGQDLSCRFVNPPNIFPEHKYLLKSRQRSANYFGKPARAHLAGFQKVSANSKAFGVRQLKILISMKLKVVSSEK
jgi:hypothetical protein